MNIAIRFALMAGLAQAAVMTVAAPQAQATTAAQINFDGRVMRHDIARSAS